MDALTCLDCNKQFQSKWSLSKHQREFHSGLRENCGKSLSRNSNLKAHEELMHKGKGFPCKHCNQTECDKQFKSLESLSMHRKEFHSGNKETHTCIECGKTFGRMSNLKAHQDVMHYGREFPCKYCKRSFTNSHLRDTHIYITHVESKVVTSVRGNNGASLPQAGNNNKSPEKISANVDDIVFAATEVEEGIKIAGKSQKGIPCEYQCPFCEKSTFNSMENYKRHVKSHEGRKCPICQKEIFRTSTLQAGTVFYNHYRTCQKRAEKLANPVIPTKKIYKCNTCDRTFDRPSLFNKHTCLECSGCHVRIKHLSLTNRHMATCKNFDTGQAPKFKDIKCLKIETIVVDSNRSNDIQIGQDSDI